MKPRSLIAFYFLVLYILIQFIWWNWLLIQQNQEIHELKTQINLIQNHDAGSVAQLGNELEQKLFHRRLMIAGESAVFLILLTLGFMRVRNTFKKEQALVQQQRNFMHSITHELKSPIASAKLTLETLQKHTLTKEKQDELFRNALADTERLNTLVENILLAAQIEQESYVIQKELLDFSAYVEIWVKEAERMHLPDQQIIQDIQPNIQLSIDKNIFSSVVLNLFENAVKYSPRNGKISIGLKKEGNGVVFSVADTGPGIPKEEKEKIFEKFYRIGNEETRKTKGTGIGLYLVKYLVEKHGGKILLKDNQPSGCIFETVLYE